MKRAAVLFGLVVFAGVALAADVKLGTTSDYAQTVGGRDSTGKVYPLRATDAGELVTTSMSSTRWDGPTKMVGEVVTDGGVAQKTVTAGAYVQSQCSVAAYMGLFTDAGTACSATLCHKYAANEFFRETATSGYISFAALAVSGTATCEVGEKQ